MSFSSYFDSVDGLTKNQRRAITQNNLGKKTFKKNPVFGYNKIRYYCPKYREGYLATKNRTTCPLCKNTVEQHEIILFDPKKGHEW